MEKSVLKKAVKKQTGNGKGTSAEKEFLAVMDKVEKLRNSPAVTEYLKAQRRTEDKKRTPLDDRYVFTSDEHYELQDTLFKIVSMARLVAYSNEQNIEPTPDDAVDVLNAMEMIEEKLRVALGILDIHPGNRPKEEEEKAA